MVFTEKKANVIQQIVRRLAATRVMGWVLARLMHRLDKRVMRWTQGRSSATSLLTGLPLVLLTTTGAKSGQPRTTPITPTPDGDRLILIASNWGQKHDPAWYLNLKAHPEVTVEYRGRSQTYVAKELTGPERDTAWQKAVSRYPGYEAYRGRTGGRGIPVVGLVRKEVTERLRD